MIGFGVKGVISAEKHESVAQSGPSVAWPAFAWLWVLARCVHQHMSSCCPC